MFKWGEIVKKALLILLVLFGIFLAIGCTGNKGGEQAPKATGTPVQAVTEVEVVTGGPAVTPVQAVVAETVTVEETPVTAVTPAVGVTGRATRTVIARNNTTAARTVIVGNNTTTTKTTIVGNKTAVSRTKVRPSGAVTETPTSTSTGGVIIVKPEK